MVRFFAFPVSIAIAALIAVYFFNGLTAFFTAALLVLLEITLSFDNAVVNARVLTHMSAVWQRRFLTWGIAVAVFGTRLVLPVLIVSVATWVSPLSIFSLALFDPAHYGELLEASAYAIHSFGAVFLLLVALKYFLDERKTLHWFHFLERHLTKWGRMEAIEIALALAAVLGISFLVPSVAQAAVLTAGVVGILLFLAMQGITSAFSIEAKETASHSIALFAYLEILDAAFSLDGVVGAFALTNAIVVIAVGLGIGAYFVRSLTLYMVREKTLRTLIFLEHGAHWAIFGLAVSMFANLLIEVPEIITGGIGVLFVVAAYWSSLRRKTAAAE